ncbi:phytanoyl-CoA dioxygenase family protein [Rhizodiscina lignyota]|uniref:Phytanoyl-CoA dioxygenase family protein n=1 Tax=Rhizodiscina lignyota TaxID=1504668 RepID=A0A9P4M859_9PEZI|nr:phytanoyl-CoA dioxygenase family protein [Rhizodiscina lignyota]
MLNQNGCAHKLSSEPIAVAVTQQELNDGRLSWPHLELAIRALHRDGLVVLEDVIDHSELDFLNATMAEDARILQAAGEDGPYNFNKGNIQQDPPATSQYFNPNIFLNPVVTQVTSSLLGPLPRLSFFSGNTALPPTPDAPPQSQPTHSDADFDFPSIPFALVINVPLVTMTPENGSTEIWLGTHNIADVSVQVGRHGERASGCIKKDVLEERRKVRPPSQPVVKKGSVVIRDLRLWHNGRPNLSEEIRVMLALIHFAPWYRNTMTIELAEELRPLVAKYEDKLQIQCKYLPEKQIMERYLKRGYGNEYDFNQADRFEMPQR